MSVRFIIGRCGSGKTEHLFRQTVAACRADPLGEPILWLVPRQATFIVERQLCCGGELNGFFRVQVMSIELLCRQVLTEVGPATQEITHVGRQMILFRLLRQHQPRLRYFKNVADKSGLAAELAVTLDELDRSGADAAALATHLSDPADTSLSDKLADLALLHRAYAGFLGVQRLDPDRRVHRAMDAFGRSQLLKRAIVYVDGFLHFTHTERRVLGALGRICPRVEIALTMGTDAAGLRDIHTLPDDMSLTHGMEMEHRKLTFAFTEAGLSVQKPLLLETPQRFKSAALRRIERWTGGSGDESPDGIELIEAPDRRAEVEFAARRVRELVAQGWRWRDIAVLARQISQYHDLIDAVFREHGIPYFVDSRRSAAHHPLIQFTRALLHAAADPWTGEAMIAIVKSGLCGLTEQESDQLENFVLLHDIRGKAWADSKDPLCRRIVDPMRPFIAAAASRRTMRQWATDLSALLDTFGVRTTLARWIADSQPEQAQEHQQVWTEFQELLDQFVELLGDQEASFSEFRDVLNSALEQFDLAIAPATVDQVLIGQADRTRTPPIRACIVLGLADCQFPLPAARPGILSSRDRRRLVGLAELEPDSRRAALDEEFLGYFAFTRPSERLIVTRAVADEKGESLAPGSLWRKLAAMFPAATPPIAPRPDQCRAADIATPRQLVSGLMRWARHPAAAADSFDWPPLYDWVAGRPAVEDRLTRTLRIARPALIYKNQAKLTPELANKLFPLPLRAQVRQLETFAACPFRHFARYGLKLAERGQGGLAERDVWLLCRDVLRHADDAALRDLIAEAAKKLRGDAALESGKNRHLLDRIEAMVTQVRQTQHTAEQRGEFRADSFAVRYGDGFRLPALKIGENLLVSGEIDQIDRSQSAVVIRDYRLNADALSLSRVYHGLTLQLVVHLLAWEASGEKAAAAALAMPILRKLRDELPEDGPPPDGEAFALLAKPRGIVDERLATSLDSQLLPGTASQVINAKRKADGEFGWRDSTDVASPDEWRSLLAHTRKVLARIAGQIASANVQVRPYKMGNTTPCTECSFADVCRFDPDDGYRKLTPMKRVAALNAMSQETQT